MLKNVGRMSPYGLYAKHTLITLEVRYRYVTHRSSTVDIRTLLYVGMKMYRTVSVLIAYMSTVLLKYVWRICNVYGHLGVCLTIE